MSDKETTEVVNNEEVLDEASAADSLKPGAAPGESKAVMLDTFVALLAQLGKEDLSNLFNRTLEQIGQETSELPSQANADANRASVAMKSVKEDLDDLLDGDELSEDFKEKTSVIFEAALNTRINLETARLEEEFEARKTELEEKFNADLEEQIGTVLEDVSDKLDSYLNYVTEQWMEDNKIAIENSLRSDITEGFIAGLQNLFAEHYIEVPAEKVDVLGEMKAEIDSLKEKLNEALDKNADLEKNLEESEKQTAFNLASEGLVETQVEKFRSLSENVEYTDLESYTKKLSIIKEGLVNKKSSSTGLITEEIDGTEEIEESNKISGVMDLYAKAISKSVK